MNEPALTHKELCLETERLMLRPLTMDDLKLVEQLVTDPEVVKYICDVMTAQDAKAETARAVKRGAGGRIGAWSVTRKEDGEKLGTAILLPMPVDLDDTDWSLVREDRYPDAEIEVGYMFRPLAWGKGYATEACRRLMRFGFEMTSLDAIVAVTDHGNKNSQHVLMKSGLKDCGTALAYQEECPYFKATREEWCQRFEKQA